MKCSKYDNEIREKALALCLQPKMNPAKVAKQLGIPRATVYDWVRTAKDNDPDYVAARRGRIRAMMDKTYAIVGRTLEGLETQSKAVQFEKKEIDRVMLKILADGGLDDARDAIIKIIRQYTGTSMTDLIKVARESLDMYDRFEGKLGGGDAGGAIQITFDDAGLSDIAE
jgi:transposase-like protein